jgi:multiple sugar transport system ATP-binding protein
VASVVVQKLTKSFPAKNGSVPALPAVNSLSLSVADGELLTLVGPSGSGKTTLLRLIAGLETPDGGTIRIGEQDQAGIAPGHREVAMVFQTLALYPHLTAEENLSFGLRLRGASQSEMTPRTHEMAERLGIADCLARRPAELSSGQRQRVALGRALMRQPKVLLLDEPFANLDAPLRRELRRELLRLQQAMKLTVILVTHDQAEAMAVGRRVAVMNAGRIEQLATPAELRSAPANDFVKSFLDVTVI